MHELKRGTRTIYSSSSSSSLAITTPSSHPSPSSNAPLNSSAKVNSSFALKTPLTSLEAISS